MIGIIGAMSEEIELIRDSMDIKTEQVKAGLKFYIGNILDKEVALVQCGIGKINASVCTQVLISEFKAKMIINTGVAGAISPLLNQGDIVLSTETVHHDFDTTPLGTSVGEIPGMQSIFKADPMLLDLAEKSTPKSVKVYKGRIASGDIFVANSQLKQSIENTFSPLCVEMEGASIGHTCYLNSVPYLIIRSISDRADGNADKSFEEFTPIAAQNSAITVLALIRNLSKDNILHSYLKLNNVYNDLVDKYVDLLNEYNQLRGGN